MALPFALSLLGTLQASCAKAVRHLLRAKVPGVLEARVPLLAAAHLVEVLLVAGHLRTDDPTALNTRSPFPCTPAPLVCAILSKAEHLAAAQLMHAAPIAQTQTFEPFQARHEKTLS